MIMAHPPMPDVGVNGVSQFIQREERHQRVSEMLHHNPAPVQHERVCPLEQFEKRARPALRELLELPFERVIVSHGEVNPGTTLSQLLQQVITAILGALG